MLLVVLISSFGQRADAAFCALRDPVSAINALYPESTEFRSIIRSIGHETRSEILDRLTFTLHFNELGKHTLYVPVTADMRPLGLVHVRSELVGRMLVEMTWAMTLDYAIADMEFQRCRLASCKHPIAQRVLATLVNRTLVDIAPMLDRLPQTLAGLNINPDSDDAVLAEAMLRSAMKTLAVTEAAWGPEVETLSSAAFGKQHLAVDGALNAKRIPMSESIFSALEVELHGGTLVLSDTIRAYALLSEGKEVARVVIADWQDNDHTNSFRWLIDNGDRVVSIEPRHPWPNAEIAQAFDNLVGIQLLTKEQCENTAQLIGFELAFVSSRTNR